MPILAKRLYTMPYKYRRDRGSLLEYNQKREYPEEAQKYVRGNGPGEIRDRYKTSKPSYPIPETHYPFHSLVVNQLWQEPYSEPAKIIKQSIRASYGSRYRVAGYSQSANKMVVIQNPVAPIVPDGRGFKAADNAARLQNFQAFMTSVNTAKDRRRR